MAFEHHILVTTFCLSMGIDQLGISSLASFEEWARRQALLEIEMARSARDPGLAVLDVHYHTVPGLVCDARCCIKHPHVIRICFFACMLLRVVHNAVHKTQAFLRKRMLYII